MDDVLVSQFRTTRARQWFRNQMMRRTRREHEWCCPRVARWSGWVTQGYQGMVQEPRIEEKSRVTPTRLAGFVRNTTRIDGQIMLLRIDGETGIDTWVDE
jgi:hypothetical protein